MFLAFTLSIVLATIFIFYFLEGFNEVGKTRLEIHLERRKYKRDKEAAYALEPPIQNDEGLWVPDEYQAKLPTKEELKEAVSRVKQNTDNQRYVPTAEELLIFFSGGKVKKAVHSYWTELNQLIDVVNLGGLNLYRYRRKCLRCDAEFIGHDSSNRICLTCKSAKYRD